MEQLLGESHIDKFEKQQFASLEEQLQCYMETVDLYFERQQFAELAEFLLYCSGSLLTSKYMQDLLYYYYELLPKVQEHCPQILDMMYTLLGHCYFISRNYEEAKSYYHLASSHAMEMDNYQLLSITLNNLNVMDYAQVPAEITFEKSTMPSVFFLMTEPRDPKILLIRLIGHIELAVDLKRIDYANQVFERHFSTSPFEKNSRQDIQLQAVKGMILYERGCYEEALLQFHKPFIYCVGHKIHQDLILYLYNNLKCCYEKLGQTMNIAQLTATKDRTLQKLFFQLPSPKVMQQQMNPSVYSEAHFTHDAKTFELLADEAIEKTENSSISLIVVDLDMKSEFQECLEAFVEFIHEHMQETFSHNLVLSARMDRSRLSYIVPLAESECDALCNTLYQKIKAQFTGNQKVYETVYFVSINNVERGLTSYEQCRDTANALIYYELYK